ncbi:carbohydrate-binding protein SusD [Pedobacter lusitanus]|uniref:Carbohydrate-binding protein SusD n=2 Tax=Pedobacter lusitanus TaxID=1503925 RepID=A0A0D0GN13_9SPHI|nr:carbohydrate-binding protein SusD [Pedobacter lusitanus]
MVGAFLLSFTGCKKELTTSSSQDVPESAIYKDVANIEAVLNGTWAYMNEEFFTYANPGYSTILRTSDAMGSDVAVNPNKYGFADAYAFNGANNQGRLEAIWTILYKVINNCNNIITKIDASSGSADKKAQVKGQALALRANSYLNLATYYQFSYLKDPQAKAVPVYTEPTVAGTEGKPKSSLEDVYKLITADLTQAETLLAKYSRSAKFKINIDVVHGLQARTYLNMGKWALAAQKAGAARADYTFMAPADYYLGFNDLSNNEWIWGQGQTPNQSNASYAFQYLDVSSESAYYYSFMADPNFKTLFDDSDIRTKLFAWDNLPGREGFLRYAKFKLRVDQTGDIVLMRSAEMVLIQAEGFARNSDLTTAVQYLNELRTARKAILFDLAGKSADDVINAILIERRKELWGEGFALSDILRTQGSVKRSPYLDENGQPKMVTITTPDGQTKTVQAEQHTTLRFPDKSAFKPNSPYYLFNIPQLELNANPNLNN